MVDRAVIGYEPFFDVKLVVFPEFAHAAPIYETVDGAARPAGRSDSQRAHRSLCPESSGAGRLSSRPARFSRPMTAGRASVFNTTCLIGPDGLLSRYRKVNPWLPWELHASPHDLPGYDEPLFPVVETEIGRLGTAICYDWLFPEAIRALALAGAEVLIRVSAYMDPWGATPAARLVDAVQSGPGRRELRLRGGGQPGSKRRQLSAVLVARGQHDRRL